MVIGLSNRRFGRWIQAFAFTKQKKAHPFLGRPLITPRRLERWLSLSLEAQFRADGTTFGSSIVASLEVQAAEVVIHTDGRLEVFI